MSNTPINSIGPSGTRYEYTTGIDGGIDAGATGTVYTNEVDVFNALQAYNVEIGKYNLCVLNPPGSGCITTDLYASHEKLKIAVADMSGAIHAIPGGQRTGSMAGAQASYITNYNNLMQQYNEVTDLRSKLDDQLKNLKDADGSVAAIYKSQYDSTIYSSILWSVLATSVIYLVFVKV